MICDVLGLVAFVGISIFFMVLMYSDQNLVRVVGHMLCSLYKELKLKLCYIRKKGG